MVGFLLILGFIAAFFLLDKGYDNFTKGKNYKNYCLCVIYSFSGTAAFTFSLLCAILKIAISIL